MFIHPTATTGNAWYRSTRIGSYVDRDGMASITCNLLGGDGIYTAGLTDGYTPSENDIDENGDFIGGAEIPSTINNQKVVADDPYWNPSNWLGTGGVFNSTSFIATKGSTSSETLKPRVNYNGTGAASEGFLDRGKTSPLGLEVADMNLKGTGFNATGYTFNPDLYSKLYDKLASLYRGNYVSKYDSSAIAEPVTLHLSKESASGDAASGDASGNANSDKGSASSDAAANVTPGTDKTTSSTDKTTSSTDQTTSSTDQTTSSTDQKTTNTIKSKKVNIKRVVISKLTSSSKKFTIVWKKLTIAKKYQIQVSTSKKFAKKSTKKYTSSKLKLTIKKGKSVKKYYVRVRGYKKVGKKTYYGAWSKTKTVKFK